MIGFVCSICLFLSDRKAIGKMATNILVLKKWWKSSFVCVQSGLHSQIAWGFIFLTIWLLWIALKRCDHGNKFAMTTRSQGLHLPREARSVDESWLHYLSHGTHFNGEVSLGYKFPLHSEIWNAGHAHLGSDLFSVFLSFFFYCFDAVKHAFLHGCQSRIYDRQHHDQFHHLRITWQSYISILERLCFPPSIHPCLWSVNTHRVVWCACRSLQVFGSRPASHNSTLCVLYMFGSFWTFYFWLWRC